MAFTHTHNFIIHKMAKQLHKFSADIVARNSKHEHNWPYQYLNPQMNCNTYF